MNSTAQKEAEKIKSKLKIINEKTLTDELISLNVKVKKFSMYDETARARSERKAAVLIKEPNSPAKALINNFTDEATKILTLARVLSYYIVLRNIRYDEGYELPFFSEFKEQEPQSDLQKFSNDFIMNLLLPELSQLKAVTKVYGLDYAVKTFHATDFIVKKRLEEAKL